MKDGNGEIVTAVSNVTRRGAPMRLFGYISHHAERASAPSIMSTVF